MKISARQAARIALMAVLISLCSWLSVPSPIPFTMQTFAVFCSLCLLGGRDGTLAVVLYLLMGAAGQPVFAGGIGGIGILLGATGGYLIGFLFGALGYWGLTEVMKHRKVADVIAMVGCILICYTFGTAWFCIVYTGGAGPISVAGALLQCVVPYIIPDALKLCLAKYVCSRLRLHIDIDNPSRQE